MGALAAGGTRACAVRAAWGRLAKTSSTAKRYSRAARRGHSQPSFYNVASQPAVSYGVQATGVADSFVRAARAQACQALGGLPTGTCPASFLHLGPDERSSDPGLLLRAEVIDAWLRLWAGLSDSDRVSVRAVWQAITPEAKHKPWSRVHGPIDSAIATLRWAGWVPLGPDRWQ